MTTEEDQKMIDILQSFVDLGKESQWKENLKDDIEATKWALEKIEKLTTERDYYKARYLEFNDGVLEGIKAKKECLHCGTGEGAYCEKCYQELIADNLKLQKKD